MFQFFHVVDMLWHYLVLYVNTAIIVGIGVVGFMYSPLFKAAFVGLAIGAIALTGLNTDIINFGKTATPNYCIMPNADPNGPQKQCWHSTDSSRGYGYWGACDDLQ